MENDIVSIPRAQYQHWCKQLCNNQGSLPATSSTAATTTSDFHNVSCLPPELLLEILGYLTGDQSTLYYVTLVCRQWFLCATPILYKHPKIYNTYRWAIFLLTLSRQKRLFHYGSLVHSIDLSCRDHGKAALELRCKDLSYGSKTTSERTDSSSSSEPSVANTSTASINNSNHVTSSAAMLTTAIIMNNDDDTDTDLGESDDDTMTHLNLTSITEQRQDELLGLLSNDDEFYMSYHPMPSLVVSTSSLIQLAKACPNLMAIDLSFTNMFSDSMVEETGDYISTLQHYAIPPGLTHVKVSIETAINTIGQQCPQLQQLKLQCCVWVCARVIWLWTVGCPNLTYLDARRSSQCTVKRLISNILQVQTHDQPPLNPLNHQQNPASLSPTSSSSSSVASSPSSFPTQAHIPRRSSSVSSSTSSSSASTSSYENSLASALVQPTSGRYWNAGEGSSTSTSTSTSTSNNNNHASTSASTSSSSSSARPSGSTHRHSAPQSSSTATAPTTERGAIGTAQADDHRRQHRDMYRPYPLNHPLPRLHRSRRRRRAPPTALERFLMTIYTNDDDETQLERILGRDDWWVLDDDFLEQHLNEPSAPQTQTNTPTTVAATITTNAPMLPPVPALNANHFTAASTIRSRVYRDFLLSTPVNQNNTIYITDQTLRQYVWSVLKEGKEQGMVELEWVHD